MTLLEAAKLARKWMAYWMEHEECDCDGEGGVAHGQCGKTERERELAEIDAAIATDGSEALRLSVQSIVKHGEKLQAEVRHNYEEAQQAMKDREAAICLAESEKKLYLKACDELKAALLQIREFTDAKAKDLEALMDLLETLTPFYFHAKALRDAGRLEPLTEISKQGSSYLVGGAFSSVLEAFEKWGEIAGVVEKRDDEPQKKCAICGAVDPKHKPVDCPEVRE